MTVKSIEDRIQDLEAQKARLRERERKLKNAIAEKERKARTRRLIQTGAIVENIYGAPIEDARREALKKFLQDNEQEFKKALHGATLQHKTKATR